MYILDTSAIRRINGKQLREIASMGVDIAASTLSILELASHLNDDDASTNYARAKGNFVKCSILRMLNDPLWTVSQNLGLDVNVTRQEDKLMLAQLINAVEASETPAELSNVVLKYPDGATTTCVDIGKRIAEELRTEESNFVKHIETLAVKYKLNPCANGRHTLTSTYLVTELTKNTQRLTPGADHNRQAKAFFATASYFGYLLSRLFLYANKRPVGETKLNIDPNDCEDAYISLSLDLLTSDVLVTDDKGTIDALRHTFSLLGEFLSAKIEPTRVLSVTEFLAAVES